MEVTKPFLLCQIKPPSHSMYPFIHHTQYRNNEPTTTTTTTTITSLGNTANTTNNTIHNNDNDMNHAPRGGRGSFQPKNNTQYSHRRTNRHRRSRSRSYSKSRSRSRSHSRSINDSMSRSPTPKKRNASNRHDRDRKRNNGSRSYHSRRPKRHTRELPYPSRSRSTSRSKSRSMSRSKSRSPSYSNDSDDRRRHRRHRGGSGRDNRYKQRHGHRGRDSGAPRRHNTMNRSKNDNENGMTNRDGRDGPRSRHNSKKISTNDKVPVSFKEFTNTMLEDDVTAQEAQKRYEKYLQRFSKSDDVLFFEAHKDEEWFQERYDPIIIEKSIESRRDNARKNSWKFYENFLGDKLPEVHDNIADFKTIPNPMKTSSPSPEPSVKNEQNDKTIKTETGTNITTTTTTTTIGGNDAAKDDDEMDVDQEDDTNTSNNNGHRIPDDGQLRLPKYADIMYRDDYMPRLRESSPLMGRFNHNECYQNSIFIQGIPLHIQREKILTPFEKCTGFEKLILSDPIRNSRKVRYGWVTFNNQENCRKALHDVTEGGLNGHQLTGQYFMNLLPKQKSKRRPKFSPPESLYPHRVMKDIKQTYDCCKKFDQEAGIKNSPLLNEKLLSNVSEMQRLNVLLLYLRRIHFLCYYCGKHFLSEEHMFARCSGTHERKVPADISLAISGNIDIATDEGGDIIKKEKTNWEKDLDQRINDVLNYVIDHKHCWIERKQLKMLEKNTKKVSDGKFRCTICSKLFKAEIYVTKHIKNKHQDEIAKYIADQRLRTMFENYRRDRDRLTIRSFEDNDNDKGSNSRDKGRKGKHDDRRLERQHHINILPQIGALGSIRGVHPHLMIAPYATHLAPGTYAYPAQNMTSPPAGVQPVQMDNGNTQPIAAYPARQGPSGTAAATASTQNNASGGVMHPERASNIAQSMPLRQGMPSNALSMSPHSRRPTRYYDRYSHNPRRDHRSPLGSLPFEDADPYGRKIPVHFQEPATRTRRSYREVDIEFPADEVEEEIDYGFGDFVKNPTKFNL
eukprot:362097_1